MLLEQLLLRYRHLRPEKEILQGILVQDVMRVNRVGRHLEIEAKIARAEAVESFSTPREAAERLAAMRAYGLTLVSER